MANAVHDDDHNPTILGVSNADGVTTIPVQASPSTHALNVEDATTGTVTNSTNASRDDNHVVAWFALSSAGDGTRVPIAVDPANGSLLVRST
jgi:hypothetical protein